MAMKNKGRKVYRSMKGKVVDLDLLIKRNELTPAVGNARVNARGDELGPGGQIVKKREEVIKDYYKGNQPVMHEDAAPRITPQEAAELESFDEEPIPPKKPATTRTTTKTSTTVADEWIEDEDGNFVKKGD